MERTRCVGVLGGFGLRPPDRLSGIGRRVVAYLAVRGPRMLRCLVSAELWPDLPETRVRANFRRALWQLPDGWVVPDGSDLVLTANVDIVDARESARRAIRGGELTWEEIELLSRDLLPGWFEDWVIEERDGFELVSVQALEAACRTAALAGDYTLATHAGYLAVRSIRCASPPSSRSSRRISVKGTGASRSSDTEPMLGSWTMSCTPRLANSSSVLSVP